MKNKPIVLIALGGNALIKKGQKGTAAEQFLNLQLPMGQIAELSRKYKIVITHGNGPQVGNLLMQQESCEAVPKLPLEILVAQTQGQIGYMLESSLDTALMEIGFSPNAGWCLGSVCRGFSCAAHALFNMKKGRAWGASRNEPMVQMIDLSMIKYVGPDDRVVPKQEDRQEYARKQKEEGEYKKWVI